MHTTAEARGCRAAAGTTSWKQQALEQSKMFGYRLAAMYVRRGRRNVATAGRHGSLEAVSLRLSTLRYVAARYVQPRWKQLLKGGATMQGAC